MTTAGQINLLDQDVYEHSGPPHYQFAWLREHAPVFWHEYGGAAGWPGFWAITRHADVMHVSRHPEIFSSERRTVSLRELPDKVVERQRLMILVMDPPRHTRQRGLVNRGFTPRTIGQLEDSIRHTCASLLDAVARRGEADFVADIAAPLPVEVICELVGAPPEDRARLYELTNRISGFDDPEVSSRAASVQATNEIYAYATELGELRRRQPRDDIVTRLLQPDGDGNELTAAEFNLFVIVLIVGERSLVRSMPETLARLVHASDVVFVTFS